MQKDINFAAVFLTIHTIRQQNPNMKDKRLLLLTPIIVFLSVISAKAQDFVGTMNIDNYTRKAVTVQIKPSYHQDKVSITMYDVKFAWMMPVTIDMKIDSVSKNGNSLAGDNIIPTTKGKKYEKYTIRNLKGNIDNDSLTFRCQMGRKQLKFNGEIKR